MPKRKNDAVAAEDDDDDEHNTREKQQQQQPPQKVYDFHKKTIEVYPQRLLELNRQFVASISSQVEAEGYSVLVGNCLDYVRQYFTYEDDLLQYSPWLATRLKQSRSDIVKCLQETIDVYEALARHDFDRILDKQSTSTSSDGSTINKTAASAPSFQSQPATTSSSASVLNFPKSTTTTAASDTTGFSVSKPTGVTTDAAPSTGFTLPKSTPTTESSTAAGFTFSKPAATSDSAPSSSFSFSKPAAAASDSSPSTGFTFSKPPVTTASESSPATGFSFSKPSATTTASDASPSTGFNFKMPTTTASPEKGTNPSPFAFSIPSSGFGTSTFSSPSFGNTGSAEKSSTSSASSISFAPPPLFSFGSTPSAAGAQQSTAEDNDDEPSEPPEPEKVEHEADAKLTYRCRMGVKKGDKLIKRGPVQAVLKEANGKHQLIIRSDDALGRLFLNILWAKPIEPKKNSTKDLTFVCQLNPGMPEVKEGEFVVILLRFDNETDRNDAHDKLTKERS